MSIIVAKFGGTSVGDLTRIRNVAAKIKKEVALGHKPVVIVSAMAGETNRLVEMTQSFTSSIDKSEADAVIASGEQVSAGLTAMALEELGLEARSLQAWQVPITASGVFAKGKITDIKADFLHELIAQDIVPVLTGFQGVTQDNRLMTLGRGGSDISAVAIAAALKADRCDIYTDVEGVYTTDPRIVPRARKLKKLSYEAMLELASVGAKVLHTRCVGLAMKYNIPLQVLSSLEDHIGSSLPGTILIKEEDIEMEQESIYGVAHTRDEAKITITDVDDIPGMAAKVLKPLSEADISVDMIVQNVSLDQRATDMTFTVEKQAAQSAVAALEAAFPTATVIMSDDVAKVSLVGIGIRSHTHVGQKMFEALAAKNINIQAITTSEIKISVLIHADSLNSAVETLHDAFELEKH